MYRLLLIFACVILAVMPRGFAQDLPSQPDILGANLVISLPPSGKLEPGASLQNEVEGDHAFSVSAKTREYRSTYEGASQRSETVLSISPSPLKSGESFTLVGWFKISQQITYLMRQFNNDGIEVLSTNITARRTLRLTGTHGNSDESTESSLLQMPLETRFGADEHFFAIRFDATQQERSYTIFFNGKKRSGTLGETQANQFDGDLLLGGRFAICNRVIVFPTAITDDRLTKLAGIARFDNADIAIQANSDGRVYEIERVAELSGPRDSVNQVRVSPDGNLIAAVSDDPALWCWEFESRKLLFSVPITDSPREVAFSPDSRFVAVSGSVEPVLYDALTGNMLGELPEEAERDGLVSQNVAFGPKSNIIYYNSGPALHRFDTNDPEWVKVVNIGSRDCRSIKINMDGSLLATAHNDQRAIIWNTESMQPIVTYKEHGGKVYGVELSPNNTFAVSCSGDRTAHIWSVPAGETLKVLRGHLDGIKSISFRNEGTEVVTGSYDGSVRIWDVESGCQIGMIEQLAANHIAVAPDSQHIVCGGGYVSRTQPLKENRAEVVSILRVVPVE